MEHTDWFLTSVERGNPYTSLDARHHDVAWTTGNLVIPLVHGRSYFTRLEQVLDGTAAGDTILFTDWRGDPDERLNGPGSEISSVLAAAAHRGVRVRGLLWRSHPDQTRFSEQENRDLADTVNSAGGEVLLDERIRRAGSHHQKLVVVLQRAAPENDVAFVGGIDLCHGRNDDADHTGDPQTIALDLRYGDRPAWHDMQAEIQGPAVGDLVETFRERWNDPLPLSHSWNRLSRFVAARASPRPQPMPEVAHCDDLSVGPHAVQVLRTYPSKRPEYPFAPQGERSIARAYEKAFERARRLIYVEDQYLWSADVARALGRALRRQPRLHVVVVLPKFPDEDGRLSGPPNRVGQLTALQHLREAGGPRFAAFNLERDRLPIYVHAKVCIVDDVWMTIGSDNLNRRSWTHDSELSCAVLDETVDRRDPPDPGGLGDCARVLARNTRLELWREHLALEDVPVDVDAGFALLGAAADRLDRWHAQMCQGKRPDGRLRRHDPLPVGRFQRPIARTLYRLVNDPDGRPARLRRLGVY